MKYKLSSNLKQHKEFISLLQKRIATLSVGASTARNMGKKGLVDRARKYLERLNLKQLSKIKSEEEFKNYLDEKIKELENEIKLYIKEGGKPFGPARKFLNIFLREVLYNRFMCAEYNLFHLEKWLEIPLDSYVVSSLKEKNKGLPEWSGVIHLTKEKNEIYQNFAKELAEEKYKTFRVHLDLMYWRETK